MSNDNRLTLNWYQQTFETYYRSLVCYAITFLGDESEAEDVVEDVFCNLWSVIDTIERGEYIKSYLYRAVMMRSLNVLRHRKVSEERIELLDNIQQQLETVDEYDPASVLENGQMRESIEKAISSLPDKCGMAFRLSYIQGLKNKEIAEAMSVSVRTIDAHIYKALKILRAELKYLLPIIAFFLSF